MDLGTTIDFNANNVIAIKRVSNVSGLISGTTVMTTGGAIPVENLKVGDHVVNPDMSTAALRNIHITVAAIAPIKIKSGALGHTCPQRDLILGPDTLVHIRDWRAQADVFFRPAVLQPSYSLKTPLIECVAISPVPRLHTIYVPLLALCCHILTQ